MGTKDIIDVLPIVESQAGGLMGYYCLGHVDKYEFTRACNAYSGAGHHTDERYVLSEEVIHLWNRTVQQENAEKGDMEFRVSEGPRQGAWAATVCESVCNNRRRRNIQFQKQYDSGKAEGMDNAIRWVMNQLRWDSKYDGITSAGELGKQIEATYYERRVEENMKP